MVDKGQVQNLNNIDLLLTLPDILLLSVEMPNGKKTYNHKSPTLLKSARRYHSI